MDSHLEPLTPPVPGEPTYGEAECTECGRTFTRLFSVHAQTCTPTCELRAWPKRTTTVQGQRVDPWPTLRKIDEYVSIAGAVKDVKPIRDLLAPLRNELR